MEEANKTFKLASNQVSYSMLNRAIENDLVPYSLENNSGIIVYSPMERGLLTGKYFKEDQLKENDHRNGYFSQFDLDKVKNFLEKIEPIAKEKGVTLSQLVLRWTTLQPAITVVLAGARNAQQAIENAKTMSLDLTQEELNFINSELKEI